MTVTFTATNYSVSAKATDLISSAMTEAGILAAGEELSGEDSQWGLEKLQRLIDQFNAREELIYNVSFDQYSLIPNHTPHTIGPAGDFNVKLRPVKLIACSLVLTSSSTDIDIGMPVRDDQWWAQNSIKSLTSTLPTDVYYSPDSPLGNLYFWPVPTQANDVRLETWTNLTQAIGLSTSLAMPQGYWDAIVLTLAVRLCPSFGKEVSATLLGMQRDAMRTIITNNMQSPRLKTSGQGIPEKSSKPGFNFLTGMPQ